MGCDIHLRLEIKAKRQSEWQNCKIFGYDRCWGDRIYGMFAVLAGVRSYNNIEHLPVRGIPCDATRSTLLAYGYEVVKDTEEQYDFQCGESKAQNWVEDFSEYIESNGIKYVSDPDWHTPSWCTTSEMEDCINRVFKKDDGGWKGDYIEWLALLGAMKGYEQSGDYECRAVFWFDN